MRGNHHETARSESQTAASETVPPKPKLLTNHRKDHIILRLRHKPKLLDAFSYPASEQPSEPIAYSPCIVWYLSHIAPDAADRHPFQVYLRLKKIPRKPELASSIQRNGRYLGLEINSRIPAIPRIITAVLKLFVPTKPTIGSTSANTAAAPPAAFALDTAHRAEASSKITAGFGIPAGWKESGPIDSQRLEPL